MTGFGAALSGEASRALAAAAVLAGAALAIGALAAWRVARGWGRSAAL
jgi:hypothetical protein